MEVLQMNMTKKYNKLASDLNNEIGLKEDN